MSETKVYAVIGVYHGVFSDIKVFVDKEQAEKCYEKMKKEFDPEEDDVQLVETELIGRT